MKIDKRILDHLKQNGFQDAAKFLETNKPKLDLSNYRLIVGGEESIWEGFQGKSYFQFYFGEKEGKKYVNDCHDEKVVKILKEMFSGDFRNDISIEESENQHMFKIREEQTWEDVRTFLIEKFKILGVDVIEEEFN